MKYHGIVIALESKMEKRGLPSKQLLDSVPYIKSSQILEATTPKTLNHKLIHPHVFASIKDRRAYLSYYDLSNLKQAACAASHIRAWAQVVERNEPCIIAEDDVFNYKSILQKTQHVLKNIQNDSRTIHMVSLLHLGSNGCRGIIENMYESSDKLYKVDHSFFGLQMYYLTPDGAKILLKYALPISMHIDRYVSDCVEINFQLYKAGGSICRYIFLDTTLYHTIPRIISIPLILSIIIVGLIAVILFKNHKIKLLSPAS